MPEKMTQLRLANLGLHAINIISVLGGSLMFSFLIGAGLGNGESTRRDPVRRKYYAASVTALVMQVLGLPTALSIFAYIEYMYRGDMQIQADNTFNIIGFSTTYLWSVGQIILMGLGFQILYVEQYPRLT